jgi:isoleucyl-tRNA synthetase
MNKKFAEYAGLNLSDINKEVMKQWETADIFHKSITTRNGAPSFVFYEGPPSANGMPGIHHVMARTIKDTFCRYKTMKGFQVNRKAGWDTHGLPVELGVEKSLGITKEDIGKKITIEDYNAACRKDVMKFTREWEELTRQIGYWVDMKNPYITYENKYIETLWWLLKQLYNKGLLYKGYTIQPYSPAAGTGLSSHELNQPGCYRDVKDTTCVAQFKVVENGKLKVENENPTFFLAWTTTPWTLPSNTALCVGEKIDYVKVKTQNPYTKEAIHVILAEVLLEKVMGKNEYEIVEKYKGADLVGQQYEQLIPWFNPGEGAFRVISGDFVTTEDGTGIVHIAPTFGADDARVAKNFHIPPVLLTDKNGNQRPAVDLQGRFYRIEDLDESFVKNSVNVDLYKDFAGRFVKKEYSDTETEDLNVDICVMLKQQGLAFKIEKHVHNYPHCWRTDKPVLYYPLDSWFIKSTACREEMMKLNDTINWKPQSTGTGRFGKWLENLNDWNLSRSRYWGTPLPVWRTEDNSEEICIGSMEELMNEIEKSVAAGLMKENPFKNFRVGDFSEENYSTKNLDLHRPYVDNIILVSTSGKPMKRETDLIDVWFDSGAMPFAQEHYPFENKEIIDNGSVYPADFISEGVDQTRGWFFTLHAISTMVKDSVAFRNVVSNGLVLDKNGNKMSKRLGNAVDPFSTIEKYGSDPLRWYMMTNASPWDNLKFDAEGIEEVRRKFFGTLYNTYSFFALYANVDNFDFSQTEIPVSERPEIDRWIISLLNTLIKEVDGFYADYEPTRAGRAISDFVADNLSNWYVRLNRKRFWGGEMDADKIAAYQTLYTCLETISRLMAPVAPFYADRLFLDLNNVTGKDKSESVHLTNFPVADDKLIDKILEERMQLAQDISSMTLALRKKVNIKVRQPLSTIMIPVLEKGLQENIEAVKKLILNEVNVKEIKFVDDSAGILVKRVKLDFKKLGPKCGKSMKEVAALLQCMSQENIAEFEKTGKVTLNIAGTNVVVEKTDVEIQSEDIPGWLVANNDNLTVALDITITDDLLKEGIAREFVNRIQNLRKTAGFDITDKIKVKIEKLDVINDAVNAYAGYIAAQTLANEVELVDKIEKPTVLDFDDFNVNILVEKV